LLGLRDAWVDERRHGRPNQPFGYNAHASTNESDAAQEKTARMKFSDDSLSRVFIERRIHGAIEPAVL
jgi:hypothetical protein